MSFYSLRQDLCINENMFFVNSSERVRVYNFPAIGTLFLGAASFELLCQVKPLKGED